MKGFLITLLVLHGINVLASAAYLVDDNYPRVKKTGVGKDTLSLVLSIGFIVWISWLIHDL